MKRLLVLVIGIFCVANSFALTRYDQRGHPYRYRCPPVCYYYYGYNFPADMFDYEVDNACVDFCIDKKHNLQYCTHVCSNYTRAYDYPLPYRRL